MRWTALFCLIGMLFIVTVTVEGQCVMCKAVAEDSAAQGAVGRGINQGILYIMAVPYILLGVFGYLVYKKWSFVE
jgi:hypothetical protein